MTSSSTIIHCTGREGENPGPASYDSVTFFGKESPRYTIGHKPEMKNDINTAPYYFNSSTIGHGPKYSLGQRISQKDQIQTPGPLFTPPPFGSESPKPSFHFKSSYSPKKDIAPGPSFVPPLMNSSPRFSMKARVFPPDEAENSSPGPAAFAPDYKKVLPNVPQLSINHRYNKRSLDSSPGPGDYSIPTGLSTKSTSFHGKPRETQSEITPGPGAYDTNSRSLVSSPRYSIRVKTESKKDVLAAPYQKIPDYFGKESPKYSFSSRPKEKSKEQSPGPSYMPPQFGNNSPRYSFSHRAKVKDLSSTPGPSFCPQFNQGTKGVTIKSRKFMPDETKAESPGPAAYSPQYDNVLSSSPKVSIKNRPEKRELQAEGLGYVALPPSDSGPKYTIGSRYKHEVILTKN